LNDSISSDTTISNNITLILSGGQGYIDFRIGDTTPKIDDDVMKQRLEDVKSVSSDESPSSNILSFMNKIERSHLIVWQLVANDNK
jgi:hypothetical protein